MSETWDVCLEASGGRRLWIQVTANRRSQAELYARAQMCKRDPEEAWTARLVSADVAPAPDPG